MTSKQSSTTADRLVMVLWHHDAIFRIRGICTVSCLVPSNAMCLYNSLTMYGCQFKAKNPEKDAVIGTWGLYWIPLFISIFQLIVETNKLSFCIITILHTMEHKCTVTSSRKHSIRMVVMRLVISEFKTTFLKIRFSTDFAYKHQNESQ